MGRKAKYSEEVKIQACKDYEKGNLSFTDISKKIVFNNNKKLPLF